MLNFTLMAWVLLPFFAWNTMIFTLKFNILRDNFNNTEVLFLIFSWLMTALCLGVIVQ